ncbi:hypothetical protein ACFFU4_16880 [Roseovarius ramblicola]|uniref:Dihydroxy-acid dehydratase n=2 Tax=Roseovarius ramblicola TaxID=2022336 RepID=A0ABV5I417_9RHOB
MQRALACAALLLALPACLALGPQGPQPPLTEATLGPGPVRVSAPRGYCIDKSSLRQLAGGGGFALLAPCAQLTATPGIAAAPALMTVSVMPQRRDAAPPDAEALAAAIAPAPVGAQGQAAGFVYAQVMQGGEAVLPGGDPRHWRGTRAVGEHLASLALYAPEGSPLAGREGRLLIGDLAAGLSAQPATADADAASDASAQDHEEAEAKAPDSPQRGFFARLFPRSN